MVICTQYKIMNLQWHDMNIHKFLFLRDMLVLQSYVFLYERIFAVLKFYCILSYSRKVIQVARYIF